MKYVLIILTVALSVADSLKKYESISITNNGRLIIEGDTTKIVRMAFEQQQQQSGLLWRAEAILSHIKTNGTVDKKNKKAFDKAVKEYLRYKKEIKQNK